MPDATTPLQAAVASYRSLGWATIRVQPCAKRPIGNGWETRTDEPGDFDPGDNIGVRLGQPSGGLVDVDLDCAEAVALAPIHLPATTTFGRASKPRSHWLYRCLTRTRKPSRTAIELRSTGAQTVFPGSSHESGEAIEWADWPESGPVSISESALLEAFGRLGLATVIARCWPEVQRHHDAHHVVLALAGALYHAGWGEPAAALAILPAAEFAGGPDPGHRAAAIQDTFADHDRGRWGLPKLAEFIGPLDTTAIERLLELVPTTPRSVGLAAEDVGNLTDLGNVERFFQDHGADLRHVKGIGWLQWDSCKWQPDFEPMGLIARSVRKLHRYAIENSDATIAKWAMQSENAARLGSIETLAKKLDVRTDVDQLDEDPWLINCPNGTIDLRTGEIRPHDRIDLITKSTTVAYNPDAQCPRFLRFLSEIFRNDLQVASYMLRFLGSALTGAIRDQIFQVWYGTGANGKSTLVELMLHVLGDYAQKMASELLTTMRRGSNAPSPDVARLRKVRFTAGVETSEGQRWNEVLVKELTGGDRIVARKLHHDPIEFAPSWKMALAVNHRPVVRGTDHGIWRRIHLVPFTQSFRGPACDPGLLDHLRDREAEGVLAVLVRGCLEWQRHGLQPPQSVLAAVEEYREGQDTIGAFLSEYLVADPTTETPRSHMYRAYRNWATESGEYCHGKQTFTRIMEERGFRLAKTQGHVQWIGVRLRNFDF